MIRLIYTLLMSALAVFVCYSMTTRAWLQTDLTELLPQSSQNTILQAAERASDAQINSQIILLAGSPRPETAFQTPSEIADLCRRCRQPVCRIPPALRRGLAGFRTFRYRQNQSPNPSAMASRKRYAVQRRQRENLGLDTRQAAR